MHDNARTSAFDSPMQARTIHGPYGPLVCDLKTKVDIDLEMAFRRKCAEAGTDHSAVLRNWVNEFIRGTSYDKAVAHEVERRSSVMRRKGPNEGPAPLVHEGATERAAFGIGRGATQ